VKFVYLVHHGIPNKKCFIYETNKLMDSLELQSVKQVSLSLPQRDLLKSNAHVKGVIA
jgi:hypothetical protein